MSPILRIFRAVFLGAPPTTGTVTYNGVVVTHNGIPVTYTA